jgi:two-component SAPR family response regulator
VLATMNKTLERPVVLIVDEDLGFIFWLGDILDEAGCESIPALNSQQAISLVRELKTEIDLLIVNPTLAGVTDMIQIMNSEQHPFQIVSTADKTLNCADNAEATLERPVLEPILRQKWLQEVRKTLRRVHASSSK